MLDDFLMCLPEGHSLKKGGVVKEDVIQNRQAPLTLTKR